MARATAGATPPSRSIQSVPNLFVDLALPVQLDRRSILLTGDARADQILRRDARGRHARCRGPASDVSILKMPHHGSIRNVTADFLRAVTAEHPRDLGRWPVRQPGSGALQLVVEVAREQGRQIELAMTNQTASSEQLRSSHPPARYGYAIRTLRPGVGALALDARVRRRPGP